MRFEEVFSVSKMEILKSISIGISGKRYPLISWVGDRQACRNININTKTNTAVMESKFTEEEMQFLSNIYIIWYNKMFSIADGKPTMDLKIIHLKKGKVFTLDKLWTNYDNDICYSYRSGFVEREEVPEEVIILFNQEMKRRRINGLNCYGRI